MQLKGYRFDARFVLRRNSTHTGGKAISMERRVQEGFRSRFLIGPAAGGRAAAEALIDGLAALKPGFDSMPVLDGRLAQPPAKQNNLVVDAAGKVEEAGFQILHLNADSINFGNALADPLQVSFNLGALLGNACGIYPHAAGEIDALRKSVETRLDILG